MALISGISEAKILEVKQTEIHDKASQSIKSKGWLPNLFRGIVAKAKDFLQNLIREKDMPPKPTLDIDMAEFRHMRSLMIKVQDKAVKIKNLQDKVLPQLKPVSYTHLKNIEIIEGLKEGEKVVTTIDTTIEDGMKAAEKK